MAFQKHLQKSEMAPPFMIIAQFCPNCILSLLHIMSLTVFQVDCYDSVAIYNYGATTIHGNDYIPFEKYAGKVILFVNVATY